MAVRAVLCQRDNKNALGVQCFVCSHYCHVADGAAGLCRMRVNRGGVLYSLSADRVAVVNLDPVEKKPLFHFLPGTTTLSLGTPGCNMTCLFCQNHGLSQGNVPPLGVVVDSLSDNFLDQTVATAQEAGAASVSFTYNEPTINAELIMELAPRAQSEGLATILVSNAYASKEGMAAMRNMIQGANFDLKSFSDEFYRDICGARLAPVLRTIAQALSFGWWVELTTLLIPGKNDSDKELRALARFIKEDLGNHVPWHISRFRPMHNMPDVPPTPIADLERAHAIGLAEGLRFVYIGNIPGHKTENTFCSGCGEIFLYREGYRASVPGSAFCTSCGVVVPGVWGIHDSCLHR